MIFDFPGITSGIGAVVYIYFGFTVVQNGRRSSITINLKINYFGRYTVLDNFIFTCCLFAVDVDGIVTGAVSVRIDPIITGH